MPGWGSSFRVNQDPHKKENKKVWEIYKSIKKFKKEEDYQNMLIYILYKHSHLNQSEIADKVGLSNSNAVGQRLYNLKKRLEIKPELRKKINEIEKHKT